MINELVKSSIIRRNLIKQTIPEFIDNSNRFYIFGATSYGLTLACSLASMGKDVSFVDNYYNESRFDQFNVWKTEQADISIPIISSIIEGRPKTAHRFLEQAGFRHIKSYFNFFILDPQTYPIPFQERNVEDVSENSDKYLSLREKLMDNLSKQHLTGVLQLRLGGDFLQDNLTYNLKNQYQLEVINFKDHFNYVDGGSFDGQTALTFSELNPNYNSIHVFEPFPDSMRATQQTLKDLDNITFHSIATWHCKEQLNFSATKGSANGIDLNGELAVQADALDALLKDKKIDFIKLDIEGAELNALHGAAEIIRSQKPLLAVCVYHSQSHFWQIPEFVLGLNPDYKIYLRHYTEGIYETVMYFV